MNGGVLEMTGQNQGSIIVEPHFQSCRYDMTANNCCRTSEEQEWTATELKNSLRSIEWDLEDLEDTIQVDLHDMDQDDFRERF